jgi:L-threonylcarbamoyladenylate synthase
MDAADTEQAALAVLRRGGVVAAATESFFGLLTDALSREALDRVFSLKPRGSDKGVPLLLPYRAAWADVAAEPGPLAVHMADRGWPGPLTIAVPARAELDPRLTLHGTVAVRLPGPSPAQRLVERFGRPVTASSANLSGEAPAVTSEQVLYVFADAVRAGVLYVLPGTSPGGKPSTLIRVGRDQLTIVRAGAIAESEIRAMEHARRPPA